MGCLKLTNLFLRFFYFFYLFIFFEIIVEGSELVCKEVVCSKLL